MTLTHQIKSNIAVFILTVAFMLLLFYNGCNKSNTESVTKLADTLSDKNWTLKAHISDTVYPPDTVYILKPVPFAVHDSIKIPVKDQRALDSLHRLCEKLNIYKDSVSDANITIYTTDSITGRLNSKQLSYKLKIPLKISETNYITANPTIGLYGGLELGAARDGTKVRIAPVIGLNIKKSSISYAYEPLNNRHNIRYTKVLFSKDPKLPKAVRKKLKEEKRKEKSKKLDIRPFILYLCRT